MSIIAAAVAFGGALRGPFQFDDVAAIVRNSTIPMFGRDFDPRALSTSVWA